ncbi:unknown [Salmonella phage FelixO1]|uniref:Uncharacterized protein n=1 Tax=Salmonella phage Felix O1 (isolate Felix O1-VT1) TaxID=1283336 RepID=Q6KGF7_BPFO1|nr:unknown [Salmonella phage FelixO1]
MYRLSLIHSTCNLPLFLSSRKRAVQPPVKEFLSGSLPYINHKGWLFNAKCLTRTCSTCST